MTEASYTAWDDKQYVWPPPEGWYQAADQKWWPEGYGPQPAPAEAVDNAAATAKDATSGVLEGVSSAGAGAADAAAGVSDAADGAVASAKDSVAGLADSAKDAGSKGLSGSLPGAGVLAGGAAAVAGLAGGAAAKAGEAAKDVAGEAVTDVADKVDPTGSVASAPSAGVFDSAPMEMNNLSPSAATPLASRALEGALPDVSMPDVSVPKVDVPEVEIPEVNLPEVDVPNIDVPDIDVPDVDVPDVNVPDLAVPDLDVPKIDVPDVHVPDVDLPKVGLPEVSAPDVGVPDVGLPEVDVPSIDQPAADLAAATELGGLPGTPEHLAPTLQSPDLAAPDLAIPDLAVPDVDAPDLASAGPDWAGAPAPDADLWANPTSVPSAEGGLADRDLVEQSLAANLDAEEYDQLDQTTIQPTGPAGFVDPQAAVPAPGGLDQTTVAPAAMAAPVAPAIAPTMVNQGLDPNDMLHAKPKGRRSLRWLWVLLGILLLAAACAAAYYFLQNQTDDAAVDPVEATGPGSAAQPHARDTGVVVFYPDGEANQRWIVEVLEPVRDATADYGTAPADGEIFAATRIRVRNESGVDGASLSDLEFNAVNAAGELIRREDNECGTTATDLVYDAAVNLGTVLEGTVCWEIPAADVAGLKLGVESNKVGGRVHIALN